MSLDAQLLSAHAVGDGARLVALYTQAAASAHDPDACGFYLTHAYIFALEVGLPQASDLRAQLVDMQREDPL